MPVTTDEFVGVEPSLFQMCFAAGVVTALAAMLWYLVKTEKKR